MSMIAKYRIGNIIKSPHYRPDKGYVYYRIIGVPIYETSGYVIQVIYDEHGYWDSDYISEWHLHTDNSERITKSELRESLMIGEL